MDDTIYTTVLAGLGDPGKRYEPLRDWSRGLPASPNSLVELHVALQKRDSIIILAPPFLKRHISAKSNDGKYPNPKT